MFDGALLARRHAGRTDGVRVGEGGDAGVPGGTEVHGADPLVPGGRQVR